MLAVLGVRLLTCLGIAYFQMFVWRPRHPDRAWPWQIWASFDGIVLVGAGMLTSSWTLAMLGAASWILARLMWDRAAFEQNEGLSLPAESVRVTTRGPCRSGIACLGALDHEVNANGRHGWPAAAPRMSRSQSL